MQSHDVMKKLEPHFLRERIAKDNYVLHDLTGWQI